MNKRLFLAFSLPDRLKQFLSELHEKYPDESIRWVKKENYHITVSFLGNISEENIPSLIKVLEEITKKTSPFTIAITGIILAPPQKTPRMIWAVGDKNTAFIQLGTIIETTLKQQSLIVQPHNNHEPLPHITLARFVESGVGEKIQNLPQLRAEIQANILQLFESRSGGKGEQPTYHLIQSFLLTLP